MRHLLLSLSCLFGIVSGGYSQTELSPFLFDTYQDAIVYMRNGMEIRGKMNYHLPSENSILLMSRMEIRQKYCRMLMR